MAYQVKVAILFANGFLQVVQNDAVIFKQFDDGLFFPSSVPGSKECIQGNELGFDLFTGEISVRLGNQIAVRAVVFNTFRNNFDRDAVKYIFFRAVAIIVVQSSSSGSSGIGGGTGSSSSPGS